MSATPVSVDVALQLLLSHLRCVVDHERVELLSAIGRICAEDLLAQYDVPAQNNSAMDGFAVRAADVRSTPVSLAISQRIPAGAMGESLQAATAARIFTGAPLPAGADAVVLQENCTYSDSQVTILQTVPVGENIRFRGEDVRRGFVLRKLGQRIRIQDISLLASAGIKEVAVRRRLRVAVLATGNELVHAGTIPGPGQIFNSNYYQLAALLNALGMQVIDCGVVADDAEATRLALDDAAKRADCVLSSGGVSVGEEDHVKSAVEKLGSLKLWKLAMKPGKPFAFGEVKGRPFFGLPGNPVSAFVTFVILVRPALLALAGACASSPRYYKLPSGVSIEKNGERQEYMRVCLGNDDSGGLALFPYNNQSSGVSASLSLADGLAVLPPFSTIAKGDLLQFFPVSELLN
jgi:molybdopterin molybdotransferase